ncbi:hypothetical protein P7H15_26065 [Paenibacillus larvae]|nr:hypothetical protein [Paenibacillus larvae]MDT2295589.1 hypothetical protein [Paenibacillus larvae]
MSSIWTLQFNKRAGENFKKYLEAEVEAKKPRPGRHKGRERERERERERQLRLERRRPRNRGDYSLRALTTHGEKYRMHLRKSSVVGTVAQKTEIKQETATIEDVDFYNLREVVSEISRRMDCERIDTALKTGVTV